jgi:hypothetical protein
MQSAPLYVQTCVIISDINIQTLLLCIIPVHFSIAISRKLHEYIYYIISLYDPNLKLPMMANADSNQLQLPIRRQLLRVAFNRYIPPSTVRFKASVRR